MLQNEVNNDFKDTIDPNEENEFERNNEDFFNTVQPKTMNEPDIIRPKATLAENAGRILGKSNSMVDLARGVNDDQIPNLMVKNAQNYGSTTSRVGSENDFGTKSNYQMSEHGHDKPNSTSNWGANKNYYNMFYARRTRGLPPDTDVYLNHKEIEDAIRTREYSKYGKPVEFPNVNDINYHRKASQRMSF